MSKLANRAWVVLAVMTVTHAAWVSGQTLSPSTERTVSTGSEHTYPSKPIRFVVPFPAGGATDIIARIVGQKLTESTGQSVILDNRGGGSSIVGTEIAARAIPDGYTILLGSFAFAITPALHERLPYDTVRDFAGVSMIGNGQAALVVHPAVPAHSVKELIALAKAKSGGLNYSSTGGGSASNLGALLFCHMAGVKITTVTFKGGSPALVALLAGEVNMTFTSIVPTLPYIRSGKLRALGVSSARRTSVLPDVPTITEAGVKGYELISWYGVLAPRRTPAAIVEKLSSELMRALRNVEVQEKLIAQGIDPVSSSPAELSKYIASEVAKWSKVIKETGARHE